MLGSCSQKMALKLIKKLVGRLCFISGFMSIVSTILIVSGVHGEEHTPKVL